MMCILLVEDEELIRTIVAEALEFHGFEVWEASTGEHAVSLIKNPPTVFSVLIADIHSPGHRNGIDVARFMRLSYPTLPIIYTTGRPDMLSKLGPLGSRETLVIKPYRPSELIQAVRVLLAA